jgi:hypothetical protein
MCREMAKLVAHLKKFIQYFAHKNRVLRKFSGMTAGQIWDFPHKDIGVIENRPRFSTWHLGQVQTF